MLSQNAQRSGSKWQLFSAFVTGKVTQVGKQAGIIQSIQREDGSGSSFNVTITNLAGVKEIIHVRTVD